MASNESNGIDQSSKTTAPRTTIIPSTIIMSLPKSLPVHLPSIMASTSVPPQVALALNNMPTPRPMIAPPNNAESKTSSSTTGLPCVNQLKPSIKAEVNVKPVKVLAPNLGPSTFIPINVSGTLNKMVVSPTGVPRVWCSMMVIP